MHRRVDDEHGWLTSEGYRMLFPDYVGGGSDRRIEGKRFPNSSKAVGR
jgi:hypothetical protein